MENLNSKVSNDISSNDFLFGSVVQLEIVNKVMIGT